MTAAEITGLVLALLVMGVGLIGSVLPVLPGLPLIFLAAVGHRLYFGDHSIGNTGLWILAALTALALLMDSLATLIGAKKLGASWWGLAGALLGGIVGLFLGVPGIILGSFVGATFLEFVSGRDFKDAVKAGAGAFIGFLGGVIVKLASSTAMIRIFAFDVIRRTTAA